MKRLTPSLITIALSLVLALFGAALTYSAPTEAQLNFSTGSIFVQSTPSPTQADRSEVGSTDEIVLMSGIISAIIIIPIFLKRKTLR